MSNKKMVMQSLLPYSVSEEYILNNIRNIAADITKECDIIVPVCCNVSKIKTVGLLRDASEIFPSLRALEYEGKKKLGQSSLIKAGSFKNNNIYFCKMFTAKHQRHRRHINYAHLVKCMLDIRNISINLKKKVDKDVQIHCSKQDMGVDSLFGGKWSTISDLIKDCWQGMEVTIYA